MAGAASASNLKTEASHDHHTSDSRLEEKDQETILRYAQNYLGYKETYLKEKTRS